MKFCRNNELPNEDKARIDAGTNTKTGDTEAEHVRRVRTWGVERGES